MPKTDWNLYSWVARGKQRRIVIEAMNKPKMPSEIRKETKLSITHVSKILKLFTEMGIAKCLTPDVRIGKIFILTEMGKRIRAEMFKMQK
jgi:DNA-binding MarR family transcriptional regulator